MSVNHYGLHIDQDLFFLIQESTNFCLNEGLQTLSVTKKVSRSNRLGCPHNIKSHSHIMPISVPTLVQKMAPIPDGGAYWVPSSARSILSRSSALSAPTRSIAFTPWAHPLKTLIPELDLTNVSPLLLLGYRRSDIAPLERLLSLPRIRTVILCGDYRVPGVAEIEVPDYDIELTPQTGWSLLYNYVNKRI